MASRMGGAARHSLAEWKMENAKLKIIVQIRHGEFVLNQTHRFHKILRTTPVGDAIGVRFVYQFSMK